MSHEESSMVEVVFRATKKPAGAMRGGRMPIIYSLSIFLLPLSLPFFLLMELAVDQIKKRTFDYHAFYPRVRNLTVISTVDTRIQRVAEKWTAGAKAKKRLQFIWRF